MPLSVVFQCTCPPSIEQLETFQKHISDVSDMFPTRDVAGVLVSRDRRIAELAVNWLNAYNTVFYATYMYSKQTASHEGVSYHRAGGSNETQKIYSNHSRG